MGTVYQDSLVHFVWFQTPNHPELVAEVGKARGRRYTGSDLPPAAFFDGFYPAPSVSDLDSFGTVYNGMVEQARSRNTVLEMSLDSATTEVDSIQLSIGVHIPPTDSTVNAMGSLMLVAVVYEDSVPYRSLVGGDTAYARFCARSVIGDTWGVPVTLRLGTDYDTVLTAPVGNWSRSHLGAAVFVQDTSNMRVLQSVGKLRFTN